MSPGKINAVEINSLKSDIDDFMLEYDAYEKSIKSVDEEKQKMMESDGFSLVKDSKAFKLKENTGSRKKKKKISANIYK